MMIPIRIHVHDHSFLGSLVGLFGSFVDAIFKLLALACAGSILLEVSLFPGIIFAIVAFCVCLIIGFFVRSAIFRFSDWVAEKKWKKEEAC